MSDGHRLTGELRLGILFPSSGGPHLAQIIDRFQLRYPGCRVRISEVGFSDPLGPLRRGEIDLMAARQPIQQPDLVVGPTLASDGRILAVALGHPLASRDSVSIEDLADCTTHDTGGMLPQEYLDALVPPSTPSGLPIRRLHVPTPSPTQVLSMVARQEIVHPTIALFPEHFRHPGVTYVPIRDLPPMPAALMWRSAERHPALRAFVAVADEVMKGSSEGARHCHAPPARRFAPTARRARRGQRASSTTPRPMRAATLLLVCAASVLPLVGAGSAPADTDHGATSRTYWGDIVSTSGADRRLSARMTVTLVLTETTAGSMRYSAQAALHGTVCHKQHLRPPCSALSGTLQGSGAWVQTIPDTPPKIELTGLSGTIRPLGPVTASGVMTGTGYTVRGRRRLYLALAVGGSRIAVGAAGPTVPGFTDP